MDRTRFPSLRSERGQSSLEYVGMIVVAAALVAALLTTDLGARLVEGMENAVCRVTGGDCAERQTAEELEPCVYATSGREASLNLQIVAVDIEQGGSYLREDRSDDTTVFTITDSASLEGALRAGAKGKVGSVGFDATAEATAGGRLTGARQYTVPTEDAAALEEALRRQGGFGQLLRDSAEATPAGPLIDVVNDKIFSEDEPALPEPSSEFISAEAIAGASAEASAEAGPLGGAGLEGALEGAGGARLITSGENEGDIEVYFQLDASAAGSLSLATLGPGVSGETSGVAVLTLQDGRTPTKLKVSASGEYNGSINLGDSLEGADLGDVARVVEDASVGGSAGSGQSIEFGGELDLTDPENRDAATALLTQGAAGVPGLVRRFDEDGTLTLQVADTSSDEFEAGANVGLGVNFGGGGSESTSDSATTSALIRPPGAQGFTVRECG